MATTTKLLCSRSTNTTEVCDTIREKYCDIQKAQQKGQNPLPGPAAVCRNL